MCPSHGFLRREEPPFGGGERFLVFGVGAGGQRGAGLSEKKIKASVHSFKAFILKK